MQIGLMIENNGNLTAEQRLQFGMIAKIATGLVDSLAKANCLREQTTFIIRSGQQDAEAVRQYIECKEYSFVEYVPNHDVWGAEAEKRLAYELVNNSDVVVAIGGNEFVNDVHEIGIKYETAVVSTLYFAEDKVSPEKKKSRLKDVFGKR